MLWRSLKDFGSSLRNIEQPYKSVGTHTLAVFAGMIITLVLQSC